MILGIVASSIAKGSFDSDYQAVLTEAGVQGYTLPSSAQQIIQNQLVVDLKSNSIWDELDTFYNFYNDGSDGFSTLNWKAPTTFALTNTSSVTWAADTGYTNTGRTGYINTNWNPSDDGVNVTLDDASYGIKIETGAASLASNQSLFGGRASSPINGERLEMYQASTNGLVYYHCNTTEVAVESVTGAIDGTVVIHRASSTSQQMYRDGVEVDTDPDVSGTNLATYDVYLLASNVSNSSSIPSDATISFYWVGSSLTALQDELHTLVDDYVTDITAL